MKTIDLQNKKFGKLMVINRFSGGKHGVKWLCKCDCGNETISLSYLLLNGKVKSCGCIKRIDFTNQTNNYWKAIEYAGKEHWKCQCRCGTIKIISTNSFKSGKSKSCGCWHSPNDKEYNERTKKRFTPAQPN